MNLPKSAVFGGISGERKEEVCWIVDTTQAGVYLWEHFSGRSGGSWKVHNYRIDRKRSKAASPSLDVRVIRLIKTNRIGISETAADIVVVVQLLLDLCECKNGLLATDRSTPI